MADTRSFGDITALFQTDRNQGSRPWRTTLTDEQMTWLNWLADQVEEWRRWPSWKATIRNWESHFPQTKPPTSKTLMRNLSDILKESGRGEWIDQG